MAKQNNQYVGPHGNQWQLKKGNGQKATQLFGTKAEAYNAGVKTAKNQHSELNVQNKNGQIHTKNSYGNDPRNKKG